MGASARDAGKSDDGLSFTRRSVVDIERRAVGHSPIRKVLWFSLFFFFGTMCRGFIRRPNRWEVINWTVQIPFNVPHWFCVGPIAVLYLFLSTYFSLSLHPVTAHFVQEHHRCDEKQETHSYYGPLNRITLNFGHHTEHHDFVNIPGSRLPQLRAIASEYYDTRKSHRSALVLMWRFITDSRMSHDARFFRPLEQRGQDSVDARRFRAAHYRS